MIQVQMLSSQNSNIDYKYSIKLYNLSRYEETEQSKFMNSTTHDYFFDKKNNLQIFHPTLAIQWRTKKNNFQEIELVDMKWEKQESTTQLRNDSTHGNMLLSGEKVAETSIALRYEYTFVFNKKKEKRFVPSLGLAASPYLQSYKSSPELSASFPTTERHTGLRMFVTPRITYFFKQKMFLDFNIPICIAQAEYSEEYTDNPSLPANQKQISSFDFNGIPKTFSARIGIGIKL